MPSIKRVFSGVQPTGKLHIGNFIGALMQWKRDQDQYDNLFCVVDLHALTIPEVVEPEQLHAKAREVAAIYLAAGLDPQKCTIFLQSSVPQHAELAWIFTCTTPLGWLERMTQYKSKASAQASVGSGLLIYPVLQAADILLYDAELVPVGEDQRQHIELARDIAQRFNVLFGDTFVLPEPVIRKTGARIMGLDDPTMKMSKSIGEAKVGHSIGVLDPPERIKKSIMSAVTDAGSVISFTESGPGVQNLLAIYEALSGKGRDEIERHFSDKRYGDLKKELVELVNEYLGPVRDEVGRLLSETGHLDEILAAGASKAQALAEQKMKQVYERLGLDAPLRYRA